MRSVLLLGAGLMQRPAILAAKRLGCRAVVVDGNPAAVCAPLADRFVPVDLKDRDALAALADSLRSGAEPLAAVFTAGTDFSANVAFVAERCGLRGHSYQACLNASDKARMRRCFAAAGVPSPGFRELTAASLADGATDGITYPQVIKPVDNMGGRGCRLVRDAAELRGARDEAVRNSRSCRAILEDVMDGAEYSIDAVVWNGTLTITGLADRHICYPPYFIEMGHTMPSSCDEKTRNELIATFALGIQSLGLTCGVAKADIKYTAAGPMVGEIAARLSGGYMSGWTYPYASGCDLTEQALLVALGETPDFLVRHRVPLPWQPHPSVAGKAQPFALYDMPCAQVSAERAWISIPGTVAAVTGLETAANTPFVRDMFPRAAAGDTVAFPRNNVQKCGNVIAVAPSCAQAEQAAYAAIQQITVRLVPHQPQTDAFLRGAGESGERGFPPPAFPAALGAYEKHPCVDSALIPAGVPVSTMLPPPLLPFLDSETDWNHGTLRQVLGRFDELRQNQYAIRADQFWRALLRGSIQGALYVADGMS
ncbi:MAG: ATP-grasp domain-containing protein [Treponemataceae bacterium]|nr:ATP-grasp domain-containing protein [Treponemataceae bacterium]